MEEKLHVEPKAETPKPAVAPVMDVVPPPAADKPQPAAPNPTPAPAAKPAKPAKPVTPKQPSNGVGMAITATVIIVLGLAALAVYAYLKTAK